MGSALAMITGEIVSGVCGFLILLNVIFGFRDGVCGGFCGRDGGSRYKMS